jgi:protein tyrosine phosphatase (PTP) superfamily phosphohydrolase (DUF442 family)
VSTEDIYNFQRVDDRLITGGQPTEDQLRSAKDEGVARVINLAPFEPDRSLADEARLVRDLGMEYHHIPVDWADPRASDFDAFERVMEEPATSTTLIHCVANFRVTAFYGLYAQKHLGWSEAQAEAFRASIWRGSDHPVWESFIRRTRTQIESARGEGA